MFWLDAQKLSPVQKDSFPPCVLCPQSPSIAAYKRVLLPIELPVQQGTVPPATAETQQMEVAEALGFRVSKVGQSGHGALWAHVFCAQWTPETHMASADSQPNVDAARAAPPSSLGAATVVAGVAGVHLRRWQMQCHICGRSGSSARDSGAKCVLHEPATVALSPLKAARGGCRLRAAPRGAGACCQCHYPGCSTPMHAQCAKEVGCLLLWFRTLQLV